MMIEFRIYHTSLTTEKGASSTTALYNNQSNEVFHDQYIIKDNIVMCLEDEYIHRKAQRKSIHDKCY